MAELTNNVYEGSVYRVSPVAGHALVHLTDKGTISAYDGERYEHIEGLAEVRTAQTVAALGYLQATGKVAMAYNHQVNPTTISMRALQMIPLEVVVRRATIGSYLKRHPQAKPEWLGTPVVEFFHKKTYDNRLSAKVDDEGLIDGAELRRLGAAEIKRLKAEKLVFPDPLLIPGRKRWWLYDASAPLDEGSPRAAIEPVLSAAQADEVKRMAITVFTKLEDGISKVDVGLLGITDCTSLRLADIKLEFGLTEWGEIWLADVVNLDSLRFIINDDLGPLMRHLSKQVFRDGAFNPVVLETYRQGLRVFQQFNSL